MRSLLTAVFSAALLAGPTALPAFAAEPGWSTTTDPRGRAFLKYIDAESKETFLTVRCLRDVDMIGIAVEGLGMPRKAKRVVLSSADGTFKLAGTVTPREEVFDFDGEADATPKALRTLRSVIEGGDGIMIKIGDMNVAELSPVTDRKVLSRFVKVCFRR